MVILTDSPTIEELNRSGVPFFGYFSASCSVAHAMIEVYLFLAKKNMNDGAS